MESGRSAVRTTGISHDESRRKRETQTLSLRKQAREELMKKRRRGHDEQHQEISPSTGVSPQELTLMVGFLKIYFAEYH